MTKVLFNEIDGDVYAQYESYLARYGFTTTQLLKVNDWNLYSDADLVILNERNLSFPNSLNEIRHRFNGGIVVSTGKYDDATQIISLELGADDVLDHCTKPRMMAAKLNALLRRLNKNSVNGFDSTSLIVIGALEINTLSRTASLTNQLVDLTSHEYELLVILAQNAGKVLNRDNLFEQIIGRPYDGQGRSIDVRISKLRRKLGDNEASPQMIKTIWKQGYCLIPSAF
ncbi:transcriptional regulatory protein RstA,putative [Pseudoalteromonas luteoviolacea B = ATCC 29581]|nr:transcriptional regulatory protein RstA,putative [Pseudoalteromonas luteoviolacea B = ATCC 29581]